MNNFPPSILSPTNLCSPLSLPISKTALLLLDFHKFIVASQPDAGRAPLANAVALRKWAKEAGMLVVHCLIDLKAATSPNRKMAARANGVREKVGSSPDACGEHEDIAAAADEFVFWRPPAHVSAVGSYGLEAFLAQHGVESLVLCGFSSSGCVINTAKGAADKEFVVTVVEDACGDKSGEAQRVIMGGLLVGQCHVVGWEEFVGAWGEELGEGKVSGFWECGREFADVGCKEVWLRS